MTRPRAPVSAEQPSLIERLCRSLAFHMVESELTLQHCEGDLGFWVDEVARAKALIAEAGFDLDVLYPIDERPTAAAPIHPGSEGVQ